MLKNLLFLLLIIPSVCFSQTAYNAPAIGSLSISDCDGILYDAGGPNGNYDNDNNAIVNIQGTSGDYLELTFTEFDVENNFDNLFIIQGDDLNTGEILYIFSGNQLPNNGQPIEIAGIEVTIVFQSDFIISGSGFAMEFSCINITDPPTANAAFPSFSCTGAVSFSDQTTGFPNSWTWDFGDGNTSSEQNPSHNYSTAGTYSVSLIACNDNGCDTLSAIDAINYDPNNFICNNGFNIPTSGNEISQACSGVLFDPGGPTGNYSSNSYGQFTIDPPGSDNISVTFSEFNLGEMGEHTDVLYISDAENYNLLGTYFGTTLPNGGQMITYDVSSILVTFSSNAQSNFSGFTMFWDAIGTPDAPTAAFSADSSNIPLGVPVSFSDESTNNPGTWEWNFGDGTTSTEQNPIHAYSTSGTFEVTLAATNCNGSDTVGNFFVTVQEAPAITINPDSINVTLDAGTITTQTVTICNNGTGDLVVDLSGLGQGAGGAFSFGFVTNENGADFSWAILDTDFNVIQESQETYAANQTYNEVVYGLGGDQYSEFIIALYSPDGVQALQEFIWYDSFTGEILFQDFLATGPNALYVLPAPIYPSDPNAGGVVEWLEIESSPTTIAPNTCIDYEVTLDATNLNGGLYEGEINIISNDPNQLNSSIPVALNVVGIPEIAVNPTTLDFGDIQVGGTSTLTFTIENAGTDDLIVSGLTSSVPQFIINHADNLELSPGTSKTIEVTFTPTTNSNYASIITLVNNAGDDIILTFLGNGIPSPTLTIDPTSFTLELIEGQDSTLIVNLGNIGEADLDYTVSSSTDGTGFDFTFTTDNWASEFSWTIVDSQGNTIDSSGGNIYNNFTTYTEEILGLLPTETYTLLLFDSFGDGALTNYSISDRVTGQLIIQGDFPQGFDQSLDLGSPTEGSSIVSPSQGTLAIGGTQALDIEISSVGLSTGTYNITITVATNDPTQPFVDVNITLFVIAPVTTDFSALEFVCGNLPAQFTDQSINVPTSWVWDFGDGNTSTEQNPTYIYASSGTYTVSLIACNSLGCDTLVKTNYVTVDTDCYTQNIPPNHGTETITVCEGNVYDSGGPSADYLEGSFGTLVIAPLGAETVTINFSEFNFAEHDFLYIYDGDQFTGSLIGTYTGNELEGQTLVAGSGILTLQEVTNHFINESGFAASFTCSSDPIAPIANFSFSNDTVLCSNEPIIFTDLSAGNVTQWFWDFGDGNISNQPNPLHIYTASGSYDVSLTVCNDAGCDTEIQPIEVTVDPNCVIDQIPVGTFGSATEVISSCGGTLYDSGGANGNYADNNYGIVTIFQSNIGITFTEFNYDLNDFVAVYDGLDITAPLIGFYTGSDLPEGGNTIFATGEGITILEYTDLQSNASGFVLDYACSGIGLNSNTNNFLVRNDNICDGVREFSTPDTMMVDTWNWNFGDNTTSNEASPIHEFPHNGIFEVSLEACYQGNCTVYTTLVHSNKLTPSIMAPDEAIVGEEVQFEGMTAEATHWNWDFSNGDFSDHNTPTTVFAAEGYYDVHVHLINMNVHETCDANHTHTILVKPDNSTSTEDLEEEKIRVYPNPANEFIQIDFDKVPTTDFEVRMFSLNGQLVKSVINQNQIDLTNLVSGSYYLQVIQDDTTPKQFKILIQR